MDDRSEVRDYNARVFFTGRCGDPAHTMVRPRAGLQRAGDGPAGPLAGGPLQLLLPVGPAQTSFPGDLYFCLKIIFFLLP